MKTELRCPSTMHGKLDQQGLIEVKCRRRHCGFQPGVVILHQFSIHTGELVKTRKFTDPGKVGSHASR